MLRHRRRLFNAHQIQDCRGNVAQNTVVDLLELRIY